MDMVLEQLRDEIAEGLRELTEAETQWRTGDDPARWSIQQIVDHLLLTYGLSAEVFAARIGKGTPTKARPSVGQWVGQVVVLRWGRFPQGRQAPAMVVPGEASETLSGEALQVLVACALERFDGLAAEAERLFGGRRGISHQVLGPMSVEQWRRFHLVHGRHHVKQIQAIHAAHGGSRR